MRNRPSQAQYWLGAAEANRFYNERRSAAAAEALVQALVWESKYRDSGAKAGTRRVDEEKAWIRLRRNTIGIALLQLQYYTAIFLSVS